MSVLDIFEKKHRLEVPLFQRQYVWSCEHQWAPLWDDIALKLRDQLTGRLDGPVHFLGAMVLDQKQTPTTHVEKRQVIDGQQRLTTLQIFLAALRDFCGEQGSGQLADEFGKLTRNTGRMADEETERYKVWPTQRDRDQFRDVMDAGSRVALERKHPLVKLPRRRKFEPRPRMVDAYLFFHAQISEFFLGAPGEPPLAAEQTLDSRLDSALHALKAGLQVVVIDLAVGDDAQVIFETLNARGEPLLPADLLRNHIFLRAARRGEQVEKLYEQYWKPFDEPFWHEKVRQGRLIRPRSDLFMQHYLASRHFAEIPVTHLFVEYKHWIESRKPFATVAAEVAAIASAREDYRNFICAPAGSVLGRFARFLDVFDVGTIQPLILTIAEASLPEAEVQDILSVLESFILRRAICGLPTKAYNRVFLNIASSLKNVGISSAALRVQLMSAVGETSLWPNDELFAEAFVRRAGYRTLTQAKISLVLMRIFEHLHSSKTERLVLDSDLSIEHLMPQQWQEHWPLQNGRPGLTWSARLAAREDDPDVLASAARDAILQGMGNLTLLTQSLNASVSNGPWSDKRKEIARYSVLPMNQMAAASEVWDEGAIRERSQYLLSVALKIWSRPQAPATP